MYRRKQRSGRRSGDLYQAEEHRKIEERRAKRRMLRRPPFSLEKLRQRAEEARRHDSDYMHLYPETLLELLAIRDRLALVQELLQLHWKMAQEEPDNHTKRDHMLWSQTIPKHRRRE